MESAARTSLGIVDSAKVFGGHKLLGHLDRVAQWQRGELPPPVTVELDLTDLCNHACPDCTFSYLVNISKASIHFGLAQDIVRQLAEFDVRGLTFSGGGEPLVYGEDKIIGLIGLAKHAGMDVGLITNGSLLTPDPRYYATCQWVRVSLDAYDAETFQRFHGRGAKEFEKVVSRVRAFAVDAAKLNYGKLTFGAGFLTDRESVQRGDFAKMARFCADIEGLDYLQFRPLVGNMVADPSLTGGYEGFSEAEALALMDACAEAAAAWSRPDFKVLASLEKYTALAQPGFGRTYDRCLGHFLEATIGADAKVYICCHGQGQSAFCLGDLREQSFAEIWHGEQSRRVYESIRPSEMCPPACRLHNQNVFLRELQTGFTHPNFI